MIAWLFGLALAADGVMDRVAAVVNDDVITLSEVYDLGGPFIKQSCPGALPTCVWETELEILDALIEATLVEQELDRLQMAITGADVDSAVDRIVREYEMDDRTALRAEVEKSGTLWDVYLEQVEQQLRTQRFTQGVLAPRVSISDDELVDFYQRTARGEQKPTVRVEALGTSILLDEIQDQKAELAELVGLLNAGTLGYPEASQRFDPAGLSGALGGRFFEKGQLVGALDGMAFTMTAGTFVGPVEVGGLLVVMRVAETGTAEGDVAPFEEVKEAVRNKLFESEIERVREEWYQRARRGAAVRIALPKP